MCKAVRWMSENVKNFHNKMRITHSARERIKLIQNQLNSNSDAMEHGIVDLR